MILTQHAELNVRADIQMLTEHWQEYRRAKREMNYHWGQVRKICRAYRVDLRKPIVFGLLVLFTGCVAAKHETQGTPPLPEVVRAAGVPEIKLELLPSPDPTVTGYRIYYGQDKNAQTNWIAAVPGTNVIVGIDPQGPRYWFTAVSRNAARVESANNPSLKNPPDNVLAFDLETRYGQTVTTQRLATFTNVPPGDSALIVPRQWKDYSP